MYHPLILCDPVVAEDGHTYERSAIEALIRLKRERGDPLISPLTNEPMGNKLVSAQVAIKTIGELVYSEHIEYEDEWLERYLAQRELKGDYDAIFANGVAKGKGPIKMQMLKRGVELNHLPSQ